MEQRWELLPAGSARTGPSCWRRWRWLDRHWSTHTRSSAGMLTSSRRLCARMGRPCVSLPRTSAALMRLCWTQCGRTVRRCASHPMSSGRTATWRSKPSGAVASRSVTCPRDCATRMAARSTRTSPWRLFSRLGRPWSLQWLLIPRRCLKPSGRTGAPSCTSWPGSRRRTRPCSRSSRRPTRACSGRAPCARPGTWHLPPSATTAWPCVTPRPPCGPTAPLWPRLCGSTPMPCGKQPQPCSGTRSCSKLGASPWAAERPPSSGRRRLAALCREAARTFIARGQAGGSAAVKASHRGGGACVP
mmetsp:Transcript_9173/g.28265  ORF Transcript_9173/g.28265 Transcript_9173/m.28265 type:complete len:302 (-) Transcript_9173:74-979(-)